MKFEKKPFNEVSNEVKQLIVLMTNPNPAKRISLQEVMKHEWL